MPSYVKGYAPKPIKASGSVPSINAPKRTSLFKSYDKAKSILPSYSPVSGLDPSKYNQLQGFDDSYWNNLSNQAAGRLNEKYFTNDDSVTNQFTNTMSKRGLLGSGIEAGGLNNIYSNYGREASDFESDLMSQRAQQDLDIADKNRTFSSDIDKTNLETGFQNKELENMIAELGLKTASDETKYKTDFDTKMFEQEVAQKKSDQDYVSSMLDKMTNLGTSTTLTSGPRSNYLSNINDLLKDMGFMAKFPKNTSSGKPKKKSGKDRMLDSLKNRPPTYLKGPGPRM